MSTRKKSQDFLLVIVTCPSVSSARRLADVILKDRLAACVNILPKIESSYWWQGRMRHAEETMLLAKTTSQRFRRFSTHIAEIHPYKLPEIIAFRIEAGLREYLAWVDVETTPEQTQSKE